MIYEESEVMKWQQVVPPIFWEPIGMFIIADRHLPSGKRQHMVNGSIPIGVEVHNADIVGKDDIAVVEFSLELSHLSTI